MTRARGQASRSLLNREFPHRVVVLSDNVRGRALDVPLDPAGWGQHSGGASIRNRHRPVRQRGSRPKPWHN